MDFFKSKKEKEKEKIHDFDITNQIVFDLMQKHKKNFFKIADDVSFMMGIKNLGEVLKRLPRQELKAFFLKFETLCQNHIKEYNKHHLFDPKSNRKIKTFTASLDHWFKTRNKDIVSFILKTYKEYCRIVEKEKKKGKKGTELPALEPKISEISEKVPTKDVEPSTTEKVSEASKDLPTITEKVPDVPKEAQTKDVEPITTKKVSKASKDLPTITEKVSNVPKEAPTKDDELNIIDEVSEASKDLPTITEKVSNVPKEAPTKDDELNIIDEVSEAFKDLPIITKKVPDVPKEVPTEDVSIKIKKRQREGNGVDANISKDSFIEPKVPNIEESDEPINAVVEKDMSRDVVLHDLKNYILEEPINLYFYDEEIYYPPEIDITNFKGKKLLFKTTEKITPDGHCAFHCMNKMLSDENKGHLSMRYQICCFYENYKKDESFRNRNSWLESIVGAYGIDNMINRVNFPFSNPTSNNWGEASDFSVFGFLFHVRILIYFEVMPTRRHIDAFGNEVEVPIFPIKESEIQRGFNKCWRFYENIVEDINKWPLFVIFTNNIHFDIIKTINGFEDVKDNVLPSLFQPSIKRNICYGDELKESLTSTLSLNEVHDRSKMLFSPSVSPSEIDDADIFTAMGLPKTIQNFYFNKKKKNETLSFPWREDFLRNRELLNGKNFVVTLNSVNDKTFVSNLIVLRKIFHKHQDCILVLPNQNYVNEKIFLYFELESFGVRVQEYSETKGLIPPIKRNDEKNTIYICTIGKANLLINSLIDEDRIKEIGLLMVDEISTIEESKDGPILEQIVHKMMFYGFSQIIGMTLILKNVENLRLFINGFDYNLRNPNNIVYETVLIDETLYEIDKNRQLKDVQVLSPPTYHLFIKDENIISLFTELFMPNRSTIIFCLNEKMCNRICDLLGSFVTSYYSNKNEERKILIERIKNLNNGLINKNLENGIKNGFGFYHYDLSLEERNLIEEAYTNETISSLCIPISLIDEISFTSNIVIIKRPTANEFTNITKKQYFKILSKIKEVDYEKDNEGLYILIIDSSYDLEFLEKFKKQYNISEDCCKSSLIYTEVLHDYILHLINFDVFKTISQLAKLIVKTLDGKNVEQNIDKIENVVKKAVNELLRNKLIEYKDEMYYPTELGKGIFLSNLYIFNGNLLYQFLIKYLQKNICLLSDFHLILLCIPLYIFDYSIDWDVFFKKLVSLDSYEEEFLHHLNITFENVREKKEKCIKTDNGSVEELKCYIAFILHDVIIQVSMFEISQKYDITYGQLEILIQNTIVNIQNIISMSLCIKKLSNFGLLLPKLIEKLKFVLHGKDYSHLQKLDYITKERAELLLRNSYDSIDKVAKASPKDILKIIPSLTLFQVKKIIQSAKALMEETAYEYIKKKIF